MKKFLTALLLCLLLGTGAVTATSTLESFSFETTAEKQRFKDLIEELRCLVCQNQSLADSDAQLAHDLRTEVYDMLQSSRSNDEIITFLVERYGDFVLYNPPVKPSTYPIWFGPFVLLLIAALLLLRSLRRQQQLPEQAITGEQREQLDRLLQDADRGDPPA
jgi:cytochrome c-type biogenesis protein CcmH